MENWTIKFRGKCIDTGKWVYGYYLGSTDKAWIAENFYFGWNAKPKSALEGAADFMVWVFWLLAFFIKPTLVRVTEYKVEKATFNMLGETNIVKNTKDN